MLTYLAVVNTILIAAPGALASQFLLTNASAVLLGALPVSALLLFFLWFLSTLTGAPAGALVVLSGLVFLVALPFALHSVQGRFDAAQMLAVLLAVAGMAAILWYTIGRSMYEWDQLQSWNRWAMDWRAGRLPIRMYEYPQIIPTLYASVYAVAGGEELRFVARFFASLLVVAAPLSLLAVRNSTAAVVAAAAMVALFAASAPWAQSGMADLPVGAFAFAGFVALRRSEDEADWKRWCLLGSLCFAASALTKQGGLFFIVAAGAVALLASQKHARSRALYTVLPAAVLVLPWYVMRAAQIAAGDQSAIIYTTSAVHADAGLWERLGRSGDMLIDQWLGVPGAIVASILVGLSLRVRDGRVVTLGFLLPYLGIYAFLFGYDVRNALPILPFLAYACGIGASVLVPSLPGFGKWPAGVAAALPLLVIAAYWQWSVSAFGTPNPRLADLVEHERQERFNIGPPQIIKALRAALAERPHAVVHTPPAALRFNGYFIDRMKPRMLTPEALSILLENNKGDLILTYAGSPETAAFIDRTQSSGAMAAVFDGDWFRIYEIVRN